MKKAKSEKGERKKRKGIEENNNSSPFRYATTLKTISFPSHIHRTLIFLLLLVLSSSFFVFLAFSLVCMENIDNRHFLCKSMRSTYVMSISIQYQTCDCEVKQKKKCKKWVKDFLVFVPCSQKFLIDSLFFPSQIHFILRQVFFIFIYVFQDNTERNSLFPFFVFWEFLCRTICTQVLEFWVPECVANECVVREIWIRRYWSRIWMRNYWMCQGAWKFWQRLNWKYLQILNKNETTKCIASLKSGALLLVQRWSRIPTASHVMLNSTSSVFFQSWSFFFYFSIIASLSRFFVKPRQCSSVSRQISSMLINRRRGLANFARFSSTF